MSKCAYFFDKATGEIIGRHIHHIKDPDQPGRLKYADSQLVITDDVWNEIKKGNKWPQFLESVTNQDPENLEYIFADDMPHNNNEYKPKVIRGSHKLERRPYFCLKVRHNPKVNKDEERERHRFYEIDSEGGVTLDMDVSVKSTQKTVEDHKSDKTLTNLSGTILAECNYGILTPRNGIVNMQNGTASFKWALPDTTMTELARCYVKDPDRKILISKSLRVRCR